MAAWITGCQSSRLALAPNLDNLNGGARHVSLRNRHSFSSALSLAAVAGFSSGQSSTPCGALFRLVIGNMTAGKSIVRPRRYLPNQSVTQEPEAKSAHAVT